MKQLRDSALPVIHLNLASDSYQPFDVSRRTRRGMSDLKTVLNDEMYDRLAVPLCSKSICAHAEPIKISFKTLKGNHFIFDVLGQQGCHSSTAENVKHQ